MRQRELLLEGLTHFFYLSMRQQALLVEVGGEGKKSMRQRELLFEGLTHFFYLSMRQRELLVEGLTHFFFICQRDNEHCSLRLGGEVKSQRDKENFSLRG